MTSPGKSNGLLRALVGLLLFGAAFGYVEAAVVVYLRGLYEPLHQRLHPDRPADDLFPILTLDQLEEAGPPYLRCLGTELAREAATLLMLAGVALTLGRGFREWLAAFGIAFGIWDIFFYLSLKALLDWPASLGTWDLLFLLPVPWSGPVLAPLIVAVGMIAGGVLVLWREDRGRPVLPTSRQWAGLAAGAGVVVSAFCWDFRTVMAGAEPAGFAWPIFTLGIALGLAAFLGAVRGGGREMPSPCPIPAARGARKICDTFFL